MNSVTATSHEERPTDANASENQIWNVPNLLSFARLILSFVVFALLPFQLYIAALVLFIIAASTDWVDGWYARRYNQVTKLGRILDPFCDKIIICGTFILLAVEMANFHWSVSIAGWMAVVVVGREMLVTGLRSFIEQSGGDFSAKMSGKLKMVFQCVAGGAGMVALSIAHRSDVFDTSAVPLWVNLVLGISLWLAILLTVYSGVQYVIAAAQLLKQPNLGSSDSP